VRRSFYTAAEMERTLFGFLYRLGSDAYVLPVVLVELLLIGLCVNWVVGVLQGTRGTKPLRGVLVILIVATVAVRVLAARYELVRLDLLYSYVLFGLAFIALVAFQPELRRAVIRMGDVRFRLGSAPQSQVVAALVKSAGYLSRNKFGALIAIQRQVDLTGWAENGTLINAEVSANLLNSIFYPGSALHDLGVIIHDTRVVAANCQFPSAESDELDAALGSRHLAAVGMSYETDALVLVVSEETGVVSIADGGKLTRYLSLDDLTEELTTRLAPRPSALSSGPGGRGAWLRRPLARLAVVVPLTCVIWYLADQATSSEATVKVRLVLRHEDTTRLVELDTPATQAAWPRPTTPGDAFEAPAAPFTVTFSGPVRAIDRLRFETTSQPLQMTWSLPDDYAPGRFSLGPREIRTIIENQWETGSRGLRVTNVDPRELQFTVVQTAVLPVRIAPDTGRVRAVIEEVRPPEATATLRAGDLPPGGERFEGTVRAIFGNELADLKPGQAQVFEHVRLDRQIVVPYRSQPLTALRVEPRDVSIQLRVVALPKRIENVPVMLLVSPEVFERYDVRRSDLNEWRISVEVQGEEAILDDLRATDLEAFVRVTPDMLPPVGQAGEAQLRTIDVTIVPKTRGVTVVSTRTVRVTLVPRTGGTP